MAAEVFMPRLTHDMQSGTLLRWLKREGEGVAAGDPLFEVETDKAVAEVQAEASGTLHGLLFKEGDVVPVGTTMASILADGDLPSSLPRLTTPVQDQAMVAVPSARPDVPSGRTSQDRLVATPVARRLASEHAVDLRRIVGSGPRGRVLEADVQRFLHEHEARRSEGSEEVPYDLVPLTRARRSTAERMMKSAQSIPHFVLEVDVDMTEAVRLHEQLRAEAGPPVSYTAILVKVIAVALHRHAGLNASFADDGIHRYHHINIGVAFATPEGLLVPVIHCADGPSLREIGEKVEELHKQAARRRLRAEHLGRATFTLSNLGSLGVDRFLALINPPEAAILAMGAIRNVPWAEAGEVQVRPAVTLRLSVDHRVMDGADAAPFLVEVRRLLENPWLLLQVTKEEEPKASPFEQ